MGSGDWHLTGSYYLRGDRVQSGLWEVATQGAEVYKAAEKADNKPTSSEEGWENWLAAAYS